MKINTLRLHGFRNLKDLELSFYDGLNVFYGENAQGKTNLLESIYLCATGRSQRTQKDAQLIAFGEEEAHIRLMVTQNIGADRIDVHLHKNKRKGVAVNEIPIKKLQDLFGVLLTVIFSPEDLSLVKSGPGERRRFLDMELCQLTKLYYFNLQQYHKVLKQRNALLKSLENPYRLPETLAIWDEQLADFGEKVMDSRKKFTEQLSLLAAETQRGMTQGKEELSLIYKPNCELGGLKEKLEKNWKRDALFKTTTSGPHKDDILFIVNGKDVRFYGSQGQQRTAALSAKLAEIPLIWQEKKEKPILLLDDVLSELDRSRQRYLFQAMDGLQIILTSTGLEDMVQQYVKKDCSFYVENGTITPGK